MNHDRRDIPQLLQDSNALLGVGAGFLLQQAFDAQPRVEPAPDVPWWSSVKKRLVAIFHRR